MRNEDTRIVRCDCCGALYTLEELTEVSDNYLVCNNCLNNYFTRCDDCGELVVDEAICCVTDANGERHVCVECAENYTPCCHCGDLYDDYMLVDGLCPDCYEQTRHYPINDRNGYLVRSYHAHHGIDLPIFTANGETLACNTLTLGAELEIDAKSRESWYENKEELAQSIIDVWNSDFVFFEDDGSLRYGFENITCPATLAFHMANKDKYKDMFRIIRESGLRSHQTSSCGLHVHFNRSFFPVSDEELCVARLLYMVEKFWDELVIFSRRSYSNLDRWAKKNNRDAFEEAKLWKQGRLDHDNRYQAVNLTNEKTIEIRIFRGTLKINTFLATLQLVSNMATYARNKDIQYLQTMEFMELINTPELERYWEKAQERHNN